MDLNYITYDEYIWYSDHNNITEFMMNMERISNERKRKLQADNNKQGC